MERFYELFREREMQTKCKYPTHYVEELAVVEKKWMDNAYWHWRFVYLDVFDINTGNKYIQERRELRTQCEKDHFVDWEMRRLEVPHRMVWDVQYESLISISEPESECIFFEDEFAANVYAHDQMAELGRFAEEGEQGGYQVLHRDMTDDEILDTFFDGDEKLFLVNMGCIPQTYDRLVCPMGNIPQLPFQQSLFTQEK